MSDRGPLISLRGVGRDFVTTAETVTAVSDVALDIRAGEFVSLQGSSGSGKSTLLSLLAGIDTPTRGSVSVDGEVVSGLPETARARLRLEKIGVVFQDDALIAELTAMENVAIPLQARGFTWDEAFNAAERELARVGIPELGQRWPDELSGGQRQRVGIARALVGDRSVLLADEPTGALDSRNTSLIFALLRQVADEGTTVVVCSHDPDCLTFADRSLVMSDGQLSERQMRED